MRLIEFYTCQKRGKLVPRCTLQILNELVAYRLLLSGLIIFCLCFCVALTTSAPSKASSKTSTSIDDVSTEFIYNYKSQVLAGINGFQFDAKVHYEFIKGWSYEASPSQWLIRLGLSQIKIHELEPDSSKTSPLSIKSRYMHLFNQDYHLYASAEHSQLDQLATIKEIYTHNLDSNLYSNIKKSILSNLIPTKSHINGSKHDNKTQSLSGGELFSPDVISSVYIQTNQRNQSSESLRDCPITIFDLVEGSQNVTFKSRVLSQAASNVTTNFSLKMEDIIKTRNGEIFNKAGSIHVAIKIIQSRSKNHYEPDTLSLRRDDKVCTNHHCRQTLDGLYNHYRGALEADSIATVQGSVAYLRLLDRLRSSNENKITEITAILKELKRNNAAQAAFLDQLAAARTKESIKTSLKYLKLPNNNNLDVAERFLNVLTVSGKTAAKMKPTTRYSDYLPLNQTIDNNSAQMASLNYIIEEILAILEKNPTKKWRSQKLRWSTLLTLGGLINAYHQDQNYTNLEDKLTKRVSTLLLKELKLCHGSGDQSADCKIVIIQAIGNVAHLDHSQFDVIQDLVLGSGGRRESIAAMKVLRDMLAHRAKDNPFSDSFMNKLRKLLVRIAYDHTQETTSRVLAAEMIVRFVPSSLNSAKQLLHHIASFKNRELATMMHSRVSSLLENQSEDQASHHNWYWKSSIINGTSSSFIKTMAKTDAFDAKYGVNVELVNGYKMLKESTFDLFLDTKERSQDLFSLGIFTRGLTNVPLISGSGGNNNNNNNNDSASTCDFDDSVEDKTENLMAGMNLKLLGSNLRPYIFFSSYFELGKHIFWGTAKNPMTAFSGSLLLIDYDEAFPLISGFVIDQQMRGVLSIDVTGKAEASLMSGSHSIVKTKASIIVQASQSIFTSYDNLWVSNLFSFGGEASIDFIADASWQTKPYQMCLQIDQPEVLIRFNSRRRYQMMADVMSRKLRRQNYHIGAKSYSLNRENNKMCSTMFNNDKITTNDEIN